MKYLLIGNSTAAIGCVEGIRSRDPEGEITIVSSENHHTYGRPLTFAGCATARKAFTGI